MITNRHRRKILELVRSNPGLSYSEELNKFNEYLLAQGGDLPEKIDFGVEYPDQSVGFSDPSRNI